MSGEIMENIKEKIMQVNEEHQLKGLSTKSKEEIIESLFIYHEELIFQNDELKIANNVLESVKNRYTVLFNEAPVIFVFINVEGKIVEYNQAASEAFEQIKVGQNLAQLIDPSSQDTFYFHFKKLMNSKENVTNYVKVTQNEKLRYYKMVSIATHIDHEKFYQCTFIDQTQEKIDEEKIQNLSYKDALTGLYNRRFFNHEIHRLDVVRNYPIGIIIADINGLKLINDAFGHQVGDELLVMTSKILKKELRNDEILTRLGGDEFAVVIPSITKEELVHLVSRIEKKTSKITVKDLNLSVAFGFAIKDRPIQNIEDVFKEAEDAMYQKKLWMTSSHHQNVITGIISTLNERHPQEQKHSERVKLYLEQLSEIEPYNLLNKQTLISAGLLHDIGKIAIEYSYLDVARQLSYEEYLEVMKHPEIGYRILKSVGVFSEVLTAILHHHEKYDGSGYPNGLKGNQIPVEARMLSVCDAYDAMLSERPYRNTYTSEEAIEELCSKAGTQFDPDIVEKFITYIVQRKET